MSCKMTIEQICGAVESPLFDRKSARIDAKALAVHLIAFANADGGVIAVGVEDDGTITGIDSYAENINELLRAPFDFCKPSVRVETERLSCANRNGKPDHILLIEVLQSSDLHANQADEVFFRVGDKSKKLNFEERLQLMYAKGTRYFEDTLVPDAGLDDLDLGFVREFTSRIGYRKSPEEYLRENKEFLSERSGKEEVSAAAMLLFGKNPKHFFPRARIRFVRYEGTEARVGARMNVIKDVMFEGRILQVTEKALEFVGSQIKERTYLGADTRFVTEPEYPEFAWKELINNKVCTFAEVKIADGSQLRRMIANNSYGSDVQLYPTDMAASANAVIAISGDYYIFRQLGITVYQRQLYRFAPKSVDSCFFTASGDMLFSRAGEMSSQEEAQQFITDNDVTFAVAFGPVMVDNGQLAEFGSYPIGENNRTYSRTAIGQRDKLHYILMTINYEDDHSVAATVSEAAEYIFSKGVVKAYALDGGQTSTMVMNGHTVNRPDWGNQRTQSDIIYFATALPEEVNP